MNLKQHLKNEAKPNVQLIVKQEEWFGQLPLRNIAVEEPPQVKKVAIATLPGASKTRQKIKEMKEKNKREMP